MPDLVLYTVEEIRNWLLHNRTVEGLTEKILSRARACAIINNPFVQEKDPVMAAVLCDGKVAAYTTAFPEMINGQRMWWFSALWCAPEFRGRGYGIVVIGGLAEVYGVDHCLDRWGASDTVGIFSYLGHNTIYTPRFIFGSRIDRTSLKGKLVFMVRSVQKYLRGLMRRNLGKEDYSLCYLPCIDDETYAFMQNQRRNDFFFHSQEMLNWELRYCFTISAPLIERVSSKSSFSSSEVSNSQMYAVQVRDNTGIVGFYVLKRNDDCMHLLYLYFVESARSKVFASIKDHIKRMHTAQFDTDNGELATYVQKYFVFPKFRAVDISFSFPASNEIPSGSTMQYGDGDNFAIVS